MTSRKSVAQKSLVEVYRHEIKNCTPISKEEEQQLGLLVLNGSSTAKNKLIKSNLRYAWKVAKSFYYGTVPFEDLLEAANLGLCKAAERFDVRYSNCFLTYAKFWIVREVKDLLRRERKGASSIDAEGEYMRYVSFDAVDDDGNETLYNTVMARESIDLESMYAFEHDSDYLYDALHGLSADEFEIVTRYFGLFDKQPETMDSIAKSFGVTRQSINQRLNRIYKLLRNHLPEDFDLVA